MIPKIANGKVIERSFKIEEDGSMTVNIPAKIVSNINKQKSMKMFLACFGGSIQLSFGVPMFSIPSLIDISDFESQI